MPGLEISVVLGYKDWGVWRLVGAVRSLKAALANIESEIIVSDYGSADYIDHKERIEAEGAIFVRTETNGIWSRSRALNAGLQVAEGEILVTTDADMVFTPATFETLLEHFKADSQQYIIMQCNDLPEGISHQDIEDGRYSWDDLTDLSTQRPRWGWAA